MKTTECDVCGKVRCNDPDECEFGRDLMEIELDKFARDLDESNRAQLEQHFLNPTIH